MKVLVCLDVETSDWDANITFIKQTQHFEAGFPCQVDHAHCTGCICCLGYCVFRRCSDDNSIYVVEKPVSCVIQLSKGETISEKAFAFHGLSDAVCVHGEELFAALRPIIALLKQGAQICCHNLAHATLVFCRELQKRALQESPHFTKEDAALLMRCLYEGHCTLALGKQRNDQYFNSLSDEYRRVFAPSIPIWNAFGPGRDAYQCGRLFLHYNHARVATRTKLRCEGETSQSKLEIQACKRMRL